MIPPSTEADLVRNDCGGSFEWLNGYELAISGNQERVNGMRDGSSNYLNKRSADIGSTLTGVMVITIIN